MTHSTPPFSLTAVCYESFNRWLSRCLHFVFRISRCLHFVRHTLSVCVDFRFAFGLYHERAPPRHHHQNPRDGASCPRLPGWAFCLFWTVCCWVICSFRKVRENVNENSWKMGPKKKIKLSTENQKTLSDIWKKGLCLKSILLLSNYICLILKGLFLKSILLSKLLSNYMFDSEEQCSISNIIVPLYSIRTYITL